MSLSGSLAAKFPSLAANACSVKEVTLVRRWDDSSEIQVATIGRKRSFDRKLNITSFIGELYLNLKINLKEWIGKIRLGDVL